MVNYSLDYKVRSVVYYSLQRFTGLRWRVSKCSLMLENDHFQFDGNKQPDSSKQLSNTKCCVYRLRTPSSVCVPELEQGEQVAKEQNN